VNADTFTYHNKTSSIVGTGNVKIIQHGKELKANTVEYNFNQNTLTATGNVVYKPDPLNVFYSNKLVIKNDFATTIAVDIIGKLDKNITLTAEDGKMLNSNLIKLNNATYTACTICGNNPPLWQIKSSNVEIDYTTEQVKHQDAKFKMLGYTIFYAPFLTHASPNAKRKSGFLAPSYTASEFTGYGVSIPYYFNLDTNRDLIMRTHIYSKRKPMLEFKYRHLLPESFWTIDTSFTKSPDDYQKSPNIDNFRGKIKIDGEQNLVNNWHLKTNLYLASDDYYLDNYYTAGEGDLNNQLYFSRSQANSFHSVDFRGYQSLNPALESKTLPITAPYYTYSYTNKAYGGNYEYSLNAINLIRQSGNEYQRLINKFQWQRNFIHSSGNIL
ncbi:MAG: LPS assembly protein LptD, partial [Pseudomonadota bacterium]